MKIIQSLLPHILIILSGILFVLLVLDWYNPTMNFVNNPVTLKLLLIFCLLTVLHSAVTIALNRKAWRELNKS